MENYTVNQEHRRGIIFELLALLGYLTRGSLMALMCLVPICIPCTQSRATTRQTLNILLK